MNDQNAFTADTRHIIAYVQRSKITHWKRLMDPGTGQPFPFIYGSRDANVFAKYVKEGAILWVFSATPDGRPPSLVAKLHVIGRADDPDGETYGVPPGVLRAFREKINGRRLYDFIAVGHPTLSRFYGYNNASNALMSLTLTWVHTTRTLSGEAPCPQGTCSWDSSFAAPLNRPALVAGDPQPLEDLARAASLSIFISWKRRDNWKRRKGVRELVYALADQGMFAWLDVFAFPPSIALSQIVDPNADLISRLLRYGYQRCNGLLALETRNYGAPGILGNWTEMEWMGRFDPNTPSKPLSFRAVYRFESSPVSAKLVQDNDCLLSDRPWQDVARIIRTKMEERFLHID